MQWYKITFNREQISKGELQKITNAFRKISQEIYFNKDFKEVAILVDDYTLDNCDVYISEKTFSLEVFKHFFEENYAMEKASLTEAKSLWFLAGDAGFAKQFTFLSR